MSGNITELHVTYGGTLAPTKFHRVVNASKQGADINKGEGTAVYLWYKQGQGDAVVDLCVLYDDEAAPEGFTKLSKNLTKGVGESAVYLAFKRAPETDETRAITDLLVLYTQDSPGEGWARVDRNLHRGDQHVFLWYKRRQDTPATEEDEDKWTPARLQVGDWFDCLDTVNKWCVAQVQAILPDNKIRIRYKGWGPKWDEDVELTSHRLAELGSHGGKAGPKVAKQGDPLEIQESEFEDMEASIAAILSNEMDKDAAEKFLKQQLPEFVEKNLRQEHVGGQAMKLRANQFFGHVLKVIVAALRNTAEPLPAHTKSMWSQLCLVDANATWFFNNCGIVKADSEEGQAAKGLYARVPASNASGYFVRDINVFGELGGYDAILERLRCTSPPINMDDLRVITMCLSVFKFCFDPAWAGPFFRQFREAVFSRLEGLADEELKELEHTSLDTLFNQLRVLLQNVCKGENVDEVLSTIQLSMIKRQIMSPYLAKRLKAEDELVRLLNAAQEAERPAAHGAGANFNRAVEISSLSCEYLAQWLVDNKIVECLLGGTIDGKTYDTHVEIVTRLSDILKFLGRAERVTRDTLDLLWAASAGSMKRAVYDMVSKMSARLSMPLLDLLAEKIAAIPPAEFDEPSLDLTRQFTAKALSKAEKGNELKWFGLKTLWDLIQDGSAVSTKTATACCGALVDLLKLRTASRQATIILGWCIDNVREGRSVPQSLELVQAYVSGFPEYLGVGATAAVGETRADVLNDLEQRYGLTPLVLAALKRYMDTAAAAGASVAQDAVRDTVFVGRYSHRDTLQTCLKFLSFLLNDSRTELTFAQIQELWQTLSTHAAHPADADEFFEWLYKARFGETGTRPYTASPPFADSTAAQVFKSLLCAVPAAKWTPAGYKCFEAFMRLINQLARRIEVTRAGYAVRDTNLEGLDTLWAMVLQCPNAAVSVDARSFLVAVHVRLADAVNKQTVWGGFVDKCMATLAPANAAAVAAAGAASSGEHEAVIITTLELLTKFLHEVEQSGRPEATERIYVYINRPDRQVTGESKQLMLPLGATVADLREVVAAAWKHPANQVRLSGFNTAPYGADTHNKLTLLQAGITATVNATLLAAPEADTQNHTAPVVAEDVDEERRFPRDMLANTSAHFHLLFELLALRNPTILRLTWALLQLLPTNKEVYTSIQTIQGAVADRTVKVDWNNLYSAAAPLKLLYSLQIVERLAQSADPADSGWSQLFVELGGFAHLYHVLMDIDVNVMLQDALSKACMSLLLKLVSLFLVIHEQNAAASSGSAVQLDQAALVVRLLQILQVTSRVLPHVDDADEAAAPAPAPAAAATANGGGVTESKTDAPNGGAAANASEAAVVRYAINLLVALLMQRPALLADLYGFSAISSAFLFGVLETPDATVRAEVSQGIQRLCTSLTAERLAAAGMTDLQAPRAFFFPLLFAEVSHASKFADRCDDYFKLLRKLVRATSTTVDAAGNESLGSVVIANLVRQVAGMIVSHPVLEATADDEDRVLRGLLSLLGAVLHNRPALKTLAGAPTECNMVGYVFDQGLFAIPTADNRGQDAPPKCKHSTTRRVAFALLAELTRGSADNARQLCQLMLPHHTGQFQAKRADALMAWDTAQVKSSTGYVGLKNLGCICYMNASMQQFFMVPKFRAGVLQFDDEEEDKKESVMFQMQRMFAYLQESEKQYFNPKDFCHAIKDMGEPTNVLVQKDASEFLGNMFMQMEQQIMGTKEERLLKHVFGGTLCSELIAEKHYSERQEPFQFLSVNVKDLKTLEEAFVDFIRGETVEYRWEEPDGTKVSLDTCKRTSISTLPSHLIVHLKRFEFDYNTLRQVKLNSYFEFPHRINLKQYTKEGRPDRVTPPAAEADAVDGKAGEGKANEGKGEEVTSPSAGSEEAKGASQEPSHPDEYYEYELMGVVVHTGTADSGHYYSFIKERDPSYDGTGPDPRRWFRFDDATVTLWDPANLERECFGGEETYGYPPVAGAGVSAATKSLYQRARNAFVLFYDRAPSKATAAAAAAAASDAGTASATARAAAASKQLAAQRQRKAMLSIRGMVPPQIFETIWSENMEHWHKRNIFNKAYFDYVWQVVNAAPITPVTTYPTEPIRSDADAFAAGGPNMPVIQLAVKFIWGTLSRSTNKEALPQWIQKLKTLFSSNVVACMWWLQSMLADPASLRDALLASVDEDTRSALADVLGAVITTLAPLERGQYGLEPPKIVLPLTAMPAYNASSIDAIDGYDDDDIIGPARPPAAAAPAPAPAANAAANAAPAARDAMPAPHGQLVTYLIEMLLGYLPKVRSYWRQFKQFFQVLTTFAELGTPEVEYLLRRSTVAKLIDLVLGANSPMGEFTGAAAAPAAANDTGAGATAGAGAGTGAGAGVTIGPLPRGVGTSAYETQPNYDSLFQLVRQLVFACKPPSGSTTSPVRGELELPALDGRMLTCRPFLVMMLSQLTSHKRIKTLKPLLEHVLWDNEALTQLLAGYVKDQVEAEEHSTELKPVFRAVALLVGIEDSLQSARAELMLTTLVHTMSSQSKYLLATETAITLLMRMSKHHEVVRAWLTANAEQWRWCATWLETHDATSLAPQPGTLLHKPHRLSQGIPANRPSSLVANVKATLEGAANVADDYDSDDEPEKLLGKRVTVRWNGNAWYQGTIVRFNPEVGQHFVRYDDGDTRWYNMSEKTFKIMGVDESWTPAMNAPDLPAATPLPGKPSAPIRSVSMAAYEDEDDEVPPNVASV